MENAVILARKTIDLWVKEKKEYNEDLPDLANKSGAFTTIHTYPEKALRGCIGYPMPVMPLKDAIIRSAIQATKDPRFPELKPEELDNIIIEVSVLTEPKLASIEDIEIGKHGLIIEKGYHSGLLLPQVAKEHHFDKKQFLEETSMKAGLMPDDWKEANVFTFQSHVYSEETPRGNIIRVL